MQENELSKSYLAALQDIAKELSLLRKALKPERPAKIDEERAEELRQIRRNIFGDED